MPFGSYYSGGGQNADYTASFGGGMGGDGGAGAGGGLNAQIKAMSSFDPSAMLNALLKYGADQQRYAAERSDWVHGRDLNEARNARNLMSMNMAHPVDPLAAARTRAQTAQMKALYERAPSKWTSFASNATNYPVLDDNALSGAQRQLYLPQNAMMMQQPGR